MDEITHFIRRRWRGMHNRCNSTKPEVAKNYRDRGIGVCAEWSEFEPFRRYVLETLGLPDLNGGIRWNIDRCDNDLGYAPGNIRWATYTQNLRNRRGNRFVEFNGEQVMIAELAERVGLSYGLLFGRIMRLGWSPEKAVSMPADKRRRTVPITWKHEIRVTHNGVTQTLREWCAELGLDRLLVASRLASGWSFDRAISTPSDKGGASKAKAERFTYQGAELTLAELEAATGIKRATLRYRLQILRLPVDVGVLPPQKLRRKGTFQPIARS